MNKEIVMIIRQSAVNDTLEELMDEIIKNKLLVRIMDDTDFEIMLRFSESKKLIPSDGLLEER